MTAMAKRSEVARFLGVDPAEVSRLIEQDHLPVVRIPGPARPGCRIYLPDLHAWLLGLRKDGPCEALKDYARFRREFDAARCGGEVKR